MSPIITDICDHPLHSELLGARNCAAALVLHRADRSNIAVPAHSMISLTGQKITGAKSATLVKSPVIHVLALIHAGPEGYRGIQEYERQVIPIVREHGGRLISAFRPGQGGSENPPDEIHLIEFPSEQAFQGYRADERVAALADLRANSIAGTVVYVSDSFVDY